MRESEIASILAKFESENGAYALVVRGLSVWRLLRAPVGLSLQNLPLVIPPLPPADLIAASVRSLINIIRVQSNGARYAVKTYSSALRIMGRNGYEDVYFEQLLREIPNGIRMHSLNAAGFSGRLNGPSKTNLDCTVVPVLGTTLARLFPVKEGEEVFERLSRLLQERFGLVQFSASRISRMFSSFWWQSRIYEWILNRLGVRTVIAADSGERALLAASHRLGIRFIELQHGVYTPEDPDCLPATSIACVAEPALLLPDVLAMYGEYWTDRHAGTAMGRLGRLHAVGASVIDKFRALRIRDFRTDPNCLKLVVTTQGMDREALIRFLADFLDLYTNPCILIIKLHPVYDVSKAPYINAFSSDPRVQIIGGNAEPSAFALISHSDFHISIASACHYDAIGIGTPTVVLGLAGHTTVTDLVTAGYALFADTPSVLKDIVSGQTSRITDSEPSIFFRHGFVQNLLPLIA
ncbi:MAG: hypothetical protein LC123_14135 [Burkholderiales bacterium]|nr:hypothetical protein [Rhodocyclaceae bacterium]MCZ2175346.1 hypothetical protein [Burkholderiales bacterium]MCZ2420960.1 hypothetical protein [Burkholderiales bacterium]